MNDDDVAADVVVGDGTAEEVVVAVADVAEAERFAEQYAIDCRRTGCTPLFACKCG